MQRMAGKRLGKWGPYSRNAGRSTRADVAVQEFLSSEVLTPSRVNVKGSSKVSRVTCEIHSTTTRQGTRDVLCAMVQWCNMA